MTCTFLLTDIYQSHFRKNDDYCLFSIEQPSEMRIVIERVTSGDFDERPRAKGSCTIEPAGDSRQKDLKASGEDENACRWNEKAENKREEVPSPSL